MSIKNKNKKTNLLTRIIKDKKGLYVSTAMKIVLSIVLGITTLTGSVLVVKDMVMPRTSEKIAEAFDNDYSSGAGGGGSSGGSTTTRNGTILEGCSYTSSSGTLGVGQEMPFAPAEGDVYKEGDYVYTYGDYNETGWSVAVVDTSKLSYGIVLSEITGKPVTNMNNTYAGCTSLTAAPTIPDGVKNMEGTFKGCSSLTSASAIPSSVTYLIETFQNCTSLEAAPVISDGVKKLDHAFSGCTKLVSAPSLPDSVDRLYETFYNCKSLTSVPNIPNGINQLYGTFQGCSRLASAPEIPSSVTSMPNTFRGCSSLTSAPNIPDNVKYLKCTFKGCKSLGVAPVIPEGIIDMEGTFALCTSLETAPVIPSSVKYMGCEEYSDDNYENFDDTNGTFYGCTALTGTLECNANPINYVCCLYGTNITSIIGSCSQATKDALLATK